jgi:hypothetical protein
MKGEIILLVLLFSCTFIFAASPSTISHNFYVSELDNSTGPVLEKDSIKDKENFNIAWILVLIVAVILIILLAMKRGRVAKKRKRRKK